MWSLSARAGGGTVVPMKPILCALTVAMASGAALGRGAGERVVHLRDFRAIELRRYTIKQGERVHFAKYFESYFPEAFQQLGAMVFGSFYERRNPAMFTWLRGFHTIEDRAIVNGAFYYGPLWKEHRTTLNQLIVDSDNVLLLEPLGPDRGIPVFPAVDPVTEPGGATGIVVAQIFAVKPKSVDAFARAAEASFAAYRAAGAREAGVLVTLDVNNNFPQLPVRTDGPYLVWLGLVQDNQVLERRVVPEAESDARALADTGLLRGAPELVILDPTARS